MTNPRDPGKVQRIMQAFGVELRRLREWRGLSQMSLSLEAEVSNRHLSFLETGKSQPSRELVTVLSSVLDLSLRERNLLLLAAGFAPETVRPSAALLSELEEATQLMLDLCEPKPALAMDRHYNLLGVNGGVFHWFTIAPELAERFAMPINAMRMLMSKEQLRPFVLNWPQLAPLILQRMYREVHARVGDVEGLALFEEMLALSGLSRRNVLGAMPESTTLLIPVEVGFKDTKLRYMTTQAGVGTAIDVTLQELRLEIYMPADAGTRAFHASMPQTSAKASRAMNT